MTPNKLKVLAISSGGGHWVQLLRLRPAFVGCHVTYATVKEGYRCDVGDDEFHVIPDSNRSSNWALLRSAFGIFLLLLRKRPDIVISTGAAPGFFAVSLGRFVGARTIWVDSVANAEELSLSGKRAGSVAGLWITQWQHLSNDTGPKYFGNILK
jgi:UDP-N-acetylglucosamine:LPS N-acetylglucosamine transferase